MKIHTLFRPPPLACEMAIFFVPLEISVLHLRKFFFSWKSENTLKILARKKGLDQNGGYPIPPQKKFSFQICIIQKGYNKKVWKGSDTVPPSSAPCTDATPEHTATSSSVSTSSHYWCQSYSSSFIICHCHTFTNQFNCLHYFLLDYWKEKVYD